VIKYKQGKENIVADALSCRYVLLSTLDARFLGFEHIKELCVGGIISLPWFSKELKKTYRRTTVFVASSLYFSFANQYSLGGGLHF
jgi:hypothetical protein